MVSRRSVLRAAGAALGAVVTGCARRGGPVATTRLAGGGRVHRVMTCNILFDLPEQKGTQFDWAAGRREVCIGLIRAQNPHLVCMQEVGRGQNADFIRAFGEFGAFGYDDPYVDTMPKRFQNIKNVILYSRERYEVVTGGQYWLSETPLVAGSRLAGEGLPRHVTWVRLRDLSTGKQFRVMDTHWGLKEPTRLAEGPMIVAEGKPYAADFPQILCGDFNSDSGSAEHRVLHEAGWRDTYAEVHGEAKAATRPGSEAGPRHRIDYVYCRGAVRAVGGRIVRAAGMPASDHPFVVGDMEI